MSVAENLACFLLNAPDLAAVKSFAEAAATPSHLKYVMVLVVLRLLLMTY